MSWLAGGAAFSTRGGGGGKSEGGAAPAGDTKGLAAQAKPIVEHDRLERVDEVPCRGVDLGKVLNCPIGLHREFDHVDIENLAALDEHASADHDAVDAGTVLHEHDVKERLVERHIVDVGQVE